ncbi:MAG: type 4a pilus biogenesis protein PilO, partial [Candidatus Omnitrophica bacterium]|nr:type 4a pilus biogenesis protein PilO [Candidatus Omnitrophota bacterium]
ADKIKADWRSKQLQLQEAENLIKILPNPRKAIEEIEKKFSDLSDVGVTKRQIPLMIQLLGKSTAENNIKVFSIKPREDIKSTADNLPAGVSKAYIEMEMTCTYKVFGEYIKVLPGLQPGFNIESVEMQKAPENEDLKSPVKSHQEAKNGELKEPALLIRLIVSTYMVWEL